MYYHVVDRRYKAVLKRLFSLLLIFSLYFNAFSFAHAAGLGGWTLGGGVSQGASVIYNGSKEVILNGVKKIATGTAKITPAASDVAKLLGKGVGGVALSVAVEQLIGAVDWVLDPANNQIVYKEPNPDNSPLIYITSSVQETSSTSPSSSCSKYEAILKSNGVDRKDFIVVYNSSKIYCVDDNGKGTRFDIISKPNPAYNPEADTKKTLPLPTVAQQVISNASSGNADAQTVVRAAADTIVAEAETDNTKARPIVQQLENTQSIPTDQTAKGEAVPKENTSENPASSPTTSTPTDISLDFPIFCDWAPSICQAAKVVITKPQEWADSIKTAYDDAVDYFKNDEKPEEDNDPPEIQDLEPPVLNTNTFKSTAGCPAPIPVNITIGTKGTTEISYEPICQFAEKWSFVAPLIGFISGAMILIGVGRKGEDSEI
ncbi:virulence factor TspB C-terminal domain-related protein [Acinetobacter ursingii]|uniref:virulence factor TspB C-terminal domain-related protein n=1 Tax=Acinetobacter ursingii TaxID=108980 RepID=UPI003AF4ADDA